MGLGSKIPVKGFNRLARACEKDSPGNLQVFRLNRAATVSGGKGLGEQGWRGS